MPLNKFLKKEIKSREITLNPLYKSFKEDFLVYYVKRESLVYFALFGQAVESKNGFYRAALSFSSTRLDAWIHTLATVFFPPSRGRKFRRTFPCRVFFFFPLLSLPSSLTSIVAHRWILYWEAVCLLYIRSLIDLITVNEYGRTTSGEVSLSEFCSRLYITACWGKKTPTT